VGYGLHETSTGYETLSEPSHLVKQPVFLAGPHKAGDAVIMDAGAWIDGAESFTLNTRPGQSAELVLRTARQVTLDLQSYRTPLTQQSRQILLPLQLPLLVNGRSVTPAPSTFSDEGFSYVVWVIPAEGIVGTKTRFMVAGAHASFAYRLYQSAESDGVREQP